MSIEELLISQNNLLSQVLTELKEIKSQSQIGDLKTCTPSQAIAIIGVNNTRYLTYFFRKELLDRRKGGDGFLYFKEQCRALADKIANKTIVLPSLKSLYDKS